MPYLLGIDASTQSVSTAVLDAASGALVAQSSVNFGRDLPHYGCPQGFLPGGQDGEVHADPRMWLAALERCLECLVESGAPLQEVVGIGGAGQQHGTVYLTAVGVARFSQIDAQEPLAEQFQGGFSRPTSPIWMDTSTTVQCREIEAALGGASVVCARSGSVAIERFSGPQIRRFWQTQPAAYAATARVHLVSSFLCSLLAGCDAPIDHGDGAGMNLLNLETLQWDAELLGATAPGLAERLPEVVPTATVVGPVAAWLVRRYGFNPQAQVVAFTGDNPASFVGMGPLPDGSLVISLGTSDTAFAATATSHSDPRGFGHVFGHPLGGFMTLQCFRNGSLAREQIRAALGLDWDAFNHAVQQHQPTLSGDRLLPFFEPEISPRRPAGVLATGTLGALFLPEVADDTPTPQLPLAAARACLEGQAANIAVASDWMPLLPQCLFLTGGASTNDTIAQVFADTFQLPVHRREATGSVAIGGALIAAHTLGLATPGLPNLAKATGSSVLTNSAETPVLPIRTTAPDTTLAPLAKKLRQDITALAWR